MKDYKRLTERNENGEAIINMQGVTNEQEARERIHEFSKLIINKLCVYEEKEESGELCEQKTCKNISEKNPVDEFICSECGFHYEDVSETREDEDGEYSYKVEFVTKYCPNCGAKVEDEE